MAISRAIQLHLEREDFEALEADWLTRLSDDPTDLDYAVGVARALAGRQEDDRAQMLLGLWDDELIAGERWRTRLDLLRRTGTLLVGVERLHEEIERTLEGMFPGQAGFAGLVELVGLHRAVDDVEKLWSKADRLLTILPYDIGTVVAMEPQGVGRVVDVNVELQKLKIEFVGGRNLMVGFRAAAKSLTRIDRDHVLYQKLEQADELRRLASEEPEELLRRVLTSFDRPMSATEIRNTLADIVPAEGWNGWWNGVRRHPQLLHQGKGRSVYSWADSAADAEETLWSSFERAGAAAQVEILRRQASSSPQLAARMAAALAERAAGLAASEPAAALEISLALERLKMRPEAAPDPRQLLAAPHEPVAILQRVADRATREDAYRLLPEAREDWPDLVATLMRREGDPKAVATLGELLRGEQEKQLGKVLDDVLSQPRKAPAAFVWLLEQAREQEAFRRRSPLRLLKQLLQALEWDEFKSARRNLLAELDSGGVAARLIGDLTPAQAEQAAEALKRAPIEGFQRTPLLNSLHMRFPELAGRKETTFYALPASITAKREELRQLQEVEIPANRRAIQEARELGDLRENFEYKSARQRHEYLAARVAALDADIHRARPIDLSAVDTGQVRVGCRVVLAASVDGSRRAYTLLGPWESEPERDILSHQSELAEKLLGRSPGDTVELPDGTFTIETIEAAPAP